MNIKRSELEILDLAIGIVERKSALTKEREYLANISLIQEYIEEPKLKKGDTENLRKFYERKIKVDTGNLRAELSRDKRIEVLSEEINGLQQQLDILRWLYKDNIQEVE